MKPESPEPAPLRGQLHGAVAISVAIHAMLLFPLTRASFVHQAEARKLEPPSMLVTLMRRPLPVVEELEEEPEVTPAPVPEEMPPESELETFVSEAVPDTTPNTALLEGPRRDVEAQAPGLTPQVLRTAVSSYLQRQRGSFTADWIAECEIYRKEHGTRDCEQIRETPDHVSTSARAGRTAGQATFASVTRPDRYALLTENFGKNNVLMKQQLRTPGVQGTLAKERYFLNREILGYLNGNPSPHGPAFQFNCKGGPCVYEYSETVVKKPEIPTEENEFRVVPALFGPQR